VLLLNKVGTVQPGAVVCWLLLLAGGAPVVELWGELSGLYNVAAVEGDFAEPREASIAKYDNAPAEVSDLPVPGMTAVLPREASHQ
jgi:hypothetical protein